jgi:hypothetical protein
MQNGSVVAWGGEDQGGSGIPAGLTNVKSIYSTTLAFAALHNDGSITAWGDESFGGSGAPNGANGMVAIYSTAGAFAAVTAGGAVSCWGDREYVFCYAIVLPFFSCL